MPNKPRQDLIRYSKQANNDLTRFLENIRIMEDIFEQAEKDHPDRYTNFLGAITSFAQIIIKTQKAWEKFRREQL